MAESYLERSYPVFADQIVEAKKAGRSDQEIEAKIHGVIRDLQQQGYEPGEIGPWLAGKKNPALRNAGDSSGGSVREFVRGMAQELTFGGASKIPGMGNIADLPEAATTPEILGRSAGEFAGQALPFKKGYDILRGGLEKLLPRAGSRFTYPTTGVAEAAKSGLAALGAGVGMSGARAAAEGENPLPAMGEAATDPYMLLGAGAGGVLAGSQAARGIRDAAAAGTAAKVMQQQTEAGSAKTLSTVDTTTQKTPTAQQVKTASARVQTSAVSPYDNLSDQNLLTFVRSDPALKNPQVKAEVEKRSLQNPAFAQLVRQEVAAAAKPAEAQPPTVATQRIEASKGLGIDRIKASLARVEAKAQTPETRRERVELQAKLDEATKTQAAPEAPVEKLLSLEDVVRSDYVQYLKEEGDTVRVRAYVEYPGGQHMALGEAQIPQSEFIKTDFGGRLGQETPKNVVTEPPKTGSPVPNLEERARRLNGDISYARLQRTFNLSYESAKQLADKLRAERGQAAEAPPVSAGAAEYSGDVNTPPNIQRAIDGFQEKLDKLTAAGKDTTNYAKGLAQAINELRTTQQVSNETRKLLGFQLTAKDLRGARETQPVGEAPAARVEAPIQEAAAKQVGEVAPTEEPVLPRPAEDMGPIVDSAPPTTEAPKVAEAQVQPVLKEGPPAQGTHQVVVRQGDKIRKVYNNLDAEGAAGIKEVTDAFFAEKGMTDYTSTINELPKMERQTRESKMELGPEGTTTGLGRSRRMKPVDTERMARNLETLRAAAGQEAPGEKPPAAPVYTTSALKKLADTKGMDLTISYEPGKAMSVEVTTQTGSKLSTPDLKTATDFLMQQPDAASTEAVNKALRQENLTRADRAEIDKFATEKAKIEPRESDPPVLGKDIPAQAPDSPPISGGAMGAKLPTPYFLKAIAMGKGWGPEKLDRFVNETTKLFEEHPGLEAAFRTEMVRDRAPFKNPFDYAGMPQFGGNALIRIITSDAVYKHSIPKYYEMRQWISYHNKWWAPLSNDQRADLSKVMRGIKDKSELDPQTQQAHVAAEQFVNDMSNRLGLEPSWGRYLGGVIDKQKLYTSWRNILTGYENFEDMPPSMQHSFGFSEERWQMVDRAFRKNENYRDLPKDVKRIFNSDIVEWLDGAKYDALPPGMKAIIPKEMWDKFSFTGGNPIVEDWGATFRAVMPSLMGELYTEPFFAKWQPLMDALPGNINGVSTKSYLYKWSQMAKGNAERGLVSKYVDGMIDNVEVKLGISLADPDFIGRLAQRTALAGYQSTLGLALDTATLNLFQNLNTWAETGRVMSGVMRKLTGSNRDALLRAVPNPKDLGILNEMSWHLVEGGEMRGLEVPRWMQKLGIDKDALKKWDQFATQYSMGPMHIAENINRGIAFAAGLEEAANMGLDGSTAIRLGIGRASQVVPNLTLTEQHLHALQQVAKTQFAYEKEFQSPYMQGSLFKLSTMFWSYPTKQLQFLSNGVAENLKDAYNQRTYETMSRATRYFALLGLTVGGPILGSYAGVNLENVFGSGLFPRLMTMPVQTAITMYQMVMGRDPVKENEWLDMWRGALYMTGVPGVRYTNKVLGGYNPITGQSTSGILRSNLGFGEGDISRGYTINRFGQRMYDTTGYGEMTRLIGIEVGKTYNERQIVRSTLEKEAQIDQERRNAISAAAGGDTGLAEKFNLKYGTKFRGELIDAEDINRWARKSATPYVQRAGRRGIREIQMEEGGYQP